jgi:hypothetical protein
MTNFPGVDVMVSIVGDFQRKNGVDRENQSYDNFFLLNLTVFRDTRANYFANFFWRKYLKNRNIGYWTKIDS